MQNKTKCQGRKKWRYFNRIDHSLPLSRLHRRGGFGLNEVIGIAAGIIIAVVVVIPGLQSFAGNILQNLTNWWNNMASSVFSTP